MADFTWDLFKITASANALCRQLNFEPPAGAQEAESCRTVSH